jgi:hypothetical protein
MPQVNVTYNNFVVGEVSPDVSSRVDLPIYNKGCEVLLNFIPKQQGTVEYRAGYTFVSHTRLNKFAVLKPYVVNDANAFFVEFTDGYVRFYKNGVHVTQAAKNITNVSTAAQAVVTSAAHGYANGDEVYLYDIVGQTELNGKSYIVADKTTDTFKIKDIFGTYISTVAMDAYVSGGTAERIYEMVSPFTEAADLTLIQVAQMASLMYCVHPSVAPQKLIRVTDTNWGLYNVTGINYPFTSTDNYPRAVAFAQGRLWYGGTNTAVDKIWGSMAPDNSGNARYDNFTTGTSDEDAVAYIIAPPSGKAEAVTWVASSSKYLLVGTYGGVCKLTGSQDDEAVTPTSVNVRNITNYGCYSTAPVILGSSTFYIQRNEICVRELLYDLAMDAYKAEDKSILAESLFDAGVTQLAYCCGRPDNVWAVRNDGVLLGMTVNKGENIYGWHRHSLGGGGLVKSIASVPRAGTDDLLGAVAVWNIDGVDRYYVVKQSDKIKFPDKLDFYTDDITADVAAYNKVVYNRQLEYNYLDCSLSFDGSAFGVAKAATLSINITAGTVTSDVSIFVAADVGREIRGVYSDTTGLGGGIYLITAVTSGTVVAVTVVETPTTEDDLAYGDWFFTTDTITGLSHLESETVQVVADGGIHPDVVVTDGVAVLDYQTAYAHFGFAYTGILKTLPVEAGGITGGTQAKPKLIKRISVRFRDTIGASVGCSMYNMEPLAYANTNQLLGRPPLPFTGMYNVEVQGAWSENLFDERPDKAVVMQENPLPCTIQLIDVFLDVVDE